MRVSTLSVIAVAGVANAATYDLVQFARGQGFIDAFYFIGGWNTTINDQAWNWWNSGDDFLTNVTQAKQKNMLSILENGNVKLGVDTVPTVVFNSKRHSFRLESRRKYGFNTVFVFDATHMPSGCAMWPAYWTTADNWPAGGEIDIMENVNRRTNNQIVFHTGGQCTMQRVPDQITGQQVLDDCQHYPDNNAGCAVRDPNNASFGSGFNEAQGGIYVTEFTSAAINVWFFSRGSIPSGLDTNSNATTIDTATLGRPVAILSNHAGCNIQQEFAEQKIIINTSLCGNFAGDAPVLNDSGCPVPDGQSCYSQFVAGAPPNTADFSQAYFEIVSHRVFQASGASSSVAQPDGPAETTTSGGGGGGPTSTNSNGIPNPTDGPGAADKTALSGGLLGTALAALLAMIM